MDYIRNYFYPPPHPAWLASLPAPLRSLASHIPPLIHLLHAYILLPVLAHFRTFSLQMQHIVRAPLAELGWADFLPPLLSLVLIYLAVSSALRTARFALNFGFWAVKWGTLVVLLAMAWGYFADGGAAVQQQERPWSGEALNRAWHAMTNPPPFPARPVHEQQEGHGHGQEYMLEVQEWWNEWMGQWLPWHGEPADVRSSWWAGEGDRRKADGWKPASWGGKERNRESDKAQRQKKSGSRVR